MKNASLVLNVLLLVAVAVLFFLHFSDKKPDATGSRTTQVGAITPGDSKIAYFEMDSVESAFAMVKDIREELSKEEGQLNNTLAGLQKKYNDRLTQYQGMQNLSSVESEKINREVLQMRDNFSATQQQLQQRFRDLQMSRTQQVNSTITDFLKKYNENKRFSYILAYEPGIMFYKDSAYNITADLVKGLNGSYKKK